MTLTVESEVVSKVTMDLTEDQLRALEALTMYGTDKFLQVFYTHLGSAYLRPHEKGLVSLFQDIKESAPAILQSITRARQNLALQESPAKEWQ